MYSEPLQGLYIARQEKHHIQIMSHHEPPRTYVPPANMNPKGVQSAGRYSAGYIVGRAGIVRAKPLGTDRTSYNAGLDPPEAAIVRASRCGQTSLPLPHRVVYSTVSIATGQPSDSAATVPLSPTVQEAHDALCGK